MTNPLRNADQTLRQRIEHNVTNVARFVSSTPEVDALFDADVVVAIGGSGGKDSVACALAVARHLDLIGHTGPRVLVHADLGSVEWKDSAPACERKVKAVRCDNNKPGNAFFSENQRGDAPIEWSLS